MITQSPSGELFAAGYGSLDFVVVSYSEFSGCCGAMRVCVCFCRDASVYVENMNTKLDVIYVLRCG
eukprot:COSAG05_NODE_131_length_17136_cov_213.547279_3_plen_66_part_00